ncbi:uncharacterized protein LOC121636116 [Melanotaenia boesemani]|uniref:uncharacterized protein LOC121636116 n=1 Tax=Melanotaenia boesemani TaxID=1250792 RepID=UPI001C04EEDA|nr:uncharacterized protein LOC121636116 [Melanotaenia boesemani]
MIEESVKCSACAKTFNRAVIAHNYLIQLNRPIQCVCGCVICLTCYRTQRGCNLHQITSAHASVNTVVSELASCPSLEQLGEWDLEPDKQDWFYSQEEVNSDVQMILGSGSLETDLLASAFEHLLEVNDSMAFRYWINEPLPQDVAYRYVCIPHVKGFWDHVFVGRQAQATSMQRMIVPDEHLPHLFNVHLDAHTFHWCCFVLKKQVILAMWCQNIPKKASPRVVTLVDRALKSITQSVAFKNMVFYLARWFSIQYERPQQDRQLKVALDCKPGEGFTLVHMLAFIGEKCGAGRANLSHLQKRVKVNLTHTFNQRSANTLFACPPDTDTDTDGPLIDIVDEYNHRWHSSDEIGLIRISTNNENFQFL